MSEEIKFVELGEVCEFQRGVSISSKDLKDENVDGKLWPWVRIGNMSENGLDFKNMKWVDPAIVKNIEKFVIQPEEILIVAVGSTSGNICINTTSNTELLFSGNIYKINVKEKLVNRKYLFYSLLMQQKKLNLLLDVGALPKLNLGGVKKIKIPLPSLERQEKIAKWLDTFTSLERQLERQKLRYQYYLNKLTWGGQLVSLKGEVKFFELGEVCEFQRGVNIDAKYLYESNKDGKCFPWIRVGNMKEGGLDFKNLKWVNPENVKNVEKFTIRDEEILIAGDGNTSGKISLNESNRNDLLISSHIFKVNAKLGVIYWKYLFYLLLEQKLLNFQTNKAAIPKLDLEEIRKLQVPLPTLEQQNKIANWLDKFRELTDQSTGKLSREILLLKKQYQYYSDRLINN